MRAKFLALGLFLGIAIGCVAGFDLAGLGYIRGITQSITVTTAETLYQTSYVTSTTSLLPPKWLYPDQQAVSYLDSGKYVGQIKTVEGTIVKTDHSISNTIFLYFHDPYKGYFVVVIYSSDFSKFKFTPNTPDVFYHGKEVRVTGKIQLYQNAPEIVVRDPSQIEVAYMGYNYP
jgi:DNA/RNA endonuclease YhcR with UshA esterase domain